jgi:hypothetical protein
MNEYQESEAVRRLMNLMSDREYKPAPTVQKDVKEDLLMHESHPLQGLAFKIDSQRAEPHEYISGHGIRNAERMRREVETALYSVKKIKEEMRSDGEDSNISRQYKAEFVSRSSFHDEHDEGKNPMKYMEGKIAG